MPAQRIKQGYLVKKPRNKTGGFKANFAKPEKRYVVLRHDEIQYFESDKLGAEVKGTILIGPETQSSINGNELVVNSAGDTLVLGLNSDRGDTSELNDWYLAIVKQVKVLAKAAKGGAAHLPGAGEDGAREAPPDVSDDGPALAEDTDDSDPDEWTVKGFLASLPHLLDELAAALTKGKNEETPEVEHFKKLDKKAVIEIICGKSTHPLHQRLADIVNDGIEQMNKAKAATAAELNNKFHLEEGVVSLRYGDLDTFYRGLEGQVGAPDPKLGKAMREEHCERPDSSLGFNTTNYNTRTTSSIEYLFVADSTVALAQSSSGMSGMELDGVRLESFPVERMDMDPALRRVPKPLDSFDHMLDRVNRQLDQQRETKMIRDELIGARLYTGPMYMKYNSVLRAGSGVPYIVKTNAELCRGNQYTTTLHVINSSIVKLGKITRACKVYRGISKGTLPDDFWRRNVLNVRGGVEFGFMSTTRDLETARFYAGETAQSSVGMIFEIEQGMVDRGADLSWLSQYPHEKEILFGPLTGLEMRSARVDGSLLLFDMKLSINLSAQTIEAVTGRRRVLVDQMSKGIKVELSAELLRDNFKLAEAIGRGFYEAVSQETLEQPPEWFNEDTQFGSAVTEILKIKQTARLVSDLLKTGETREVDADRLASQKRVAYGGDDGGGGGGRRTSIGSGSSTEPTRSSLELYKSGKQPVLGVHGACVVAEWARDHKSLTYLGMRGTGIADEGAAHIIDAVVGHPKLCSLDLRETGITSNSLRRLTQKLRLCTSPQLAYLQVDDWSLALRSSEVILKKEASETDLELVFALLRANTELRCIRIGGAAGANLLQGLGDQVPMLSGATRISTLMVHSNSDTTPTTWRCVADMLKYNSSLTVADFLRNGIDTESALKLRDVGVSEGKMLSGITFEQPEFDLSSLGLKEADGVLLACDLTISRKLRQLNLQNNELGKSSAKAIAEALVRNQRCALTSLNLRDNRLGIEGGRLIGKALEANSSVTSLDTRENDISGEGMITLANAVLASTSIATFGDVPVAELREDSKESLVLTGRSLGPSEARVLAGLLKDNKRCATVDLSGNTLCGLSKRGDGVFTAEGVVEFAKMLEHNAAITSLNLNDNALCGSKFGVQRAHEIDAVRALAAALRINTTLTELQLNSNQLGDVGWRMAFEALGDNPKNSIAKWELASHGLGASVAPALGKYLETTQSLLTLNLRANAIGAKGAQCIAEALKQNLSLQVLDTRQNEFTESTEMRLAEAVLSSPTLQLFGEVPVAQLRANAVESLDLQEKSLGPCEARVVAMLFGDAKGGPGASANRSVTAIDLGRNAMGDKATFHLVQTLKELDQMREIGLAGCSVPPDAMRILTEFIRVSTHMQALDLRANHLSADAVKQLNAANASRPSKISIQF